MAETRFTHRLSSAGLAVGALLIGAAAVPLESCGGDKTEAPEPAAVKVPPPSLRRLTQAQYRNTVHDVLGADLVVGGGLEPGSEAGRQPLGERSAGSASFPHHCLAGFAQDQNCASRPQAIRPVFRAMPPVDDERTYHRRSQPVHRACGLSLAGLALVVGGPFRL